MSAATPATCGLDMDVPGMAWKSCPAAPGFSESGASVLPARILTPGAVTSGLIKSESKVFGPRDEKAAITESWAPAASPPLRDAVAVPGLAAI